MEIKKTNYFIHGILSVMLLLLVFCNQEIIVDKRCEGVECQNGGTCVEGVCDCPDGVQGSLCERVDHCTDKECQNGGRCVNGECRCPEGFAGENCEKETLTITAFNKVRLDYNMGINNNQSTQTFTLIDSDEIENIEAIHMYIELRCPTSSPAGCDEWDRYANIAIKGPEATETWYELGRYITPYGIGNEKRYRGFKMDVTDFKSMLHGEVELEAFIGTFSGKGWLVTVKFDYVKGEPEFAYSAIIPILNLSLRASGVPYGVPHNKKLDGRITIPAMNIAQVELRTIITGHGHAGRYTVNGNCAEWCFRTHTLRFGSDTFTHRLQGIGCRSNPVSPQPGNWPVDRAGWCPGMEVPIRQNTLSKTYSGETISFAYEFEPWTTPEADPLSQFAQYGISTFLVLKSHQPITELPTIAE